LVNVASVFLRPRRFFYATVDFVVENACTACQCLFVKGDIALVLWRLKMDKYYVWLSSDGFLRATVITAINSFEARRELAARSGVSVFSCAARAVKEC
jgi:hypothetical protein